VEVCLGRILLSADRQIANAAFVAGGAIVSVWLNLLWVPRFEVHGAIYAGIVAYAAIDILCIAALKRPLSGAALLRMFLPLSVAVALSSGVCAWLAQRDYTMLPQAIAAAAVFVSIAALSYRRRHVAWSAA
jgi:O-antigen/teichoic acid export membrane protein